MERTGVQIPADGVELEGELCVPPGAIGLVLIAHECGTGCRSPSNRFVAWIHQCAGLGTLSLDLLTQREEMADTAHGRLRGDVRMLARRLIACTVWTATHPSAARLDMGFLGYCTGAPAALIAASRLHDAIGAVVSWSGRPDLADAVLPDVIAPTLLIVGDRDDDLLEQNREAFARLSCEKRLDVIPNMTRAIEEPCAINAVASTAAHWFKTHLSPTRTSARHDRETKPHSTASRRDT